MRETESEATARVAFFFVEGCAVFLVAPWIAWSLHHDDGFVIFVREYVRAAANLGMWFGTISIPVSIAWMYVRVSRTTPDLPRTRDTARVLSLELLLVVLLAVMLFAVGQPLEAPRLRWSDVALFVKVLLGASVPCVFAAISLVHGKTRRDQRIAEKLREPMRPEVVEPASPKSRLRWTQSERSGLLAFVYSEGFAVFVLGGTCSVFQGLGGNSDGAFVWFATDFGWWSGALTMPLSIGYMFLAASWAQLAMPTWQEVAKVLLVEGLVIGILADFHAGIADLPTLTQAFAWSDLRTFAVILAGASCVSAFACGLLWLDARRRSRADG